MASEGSSLDNIESKINAALAALSSTKKPKKVRG